MPHVGVCVLSCGLWSLGRRGEHESQCFYSLVLHSVRTFIVSRRYVLWRPSDLPAHLFAHRQRPLLLRWVQVVFLYRGLALRVSWAHPGCGVFILLSGALLWWVCDKYPRTTGLPWGSPLGCSGFLLHKMWMLFLHLGHRVFWSICGSGHGQLFSASEGLY